MKVAIITCYKYPDYGRAAVLRTAIQANPKANTFIIKNHHRGILRYPEVIVKTFWTRLRKRPDAYLITFRGYEILPAILLIALGKPVILDELVNPQEVVSEHQQQREGTWVSGLMSTWSLFASFYNFLLRRCRYVIADTNIHADYSAEHSGAPRDRYRVIPVGADETIFKPPTKATVLRSNDFTVLYYGSMVPLHGLEYVLAAAVELRHKPHIKFLLVGGGSAAAQQIAKALDQGAHIEYRGWIEPHDLPRIINTTGLCLGGPFGDTRQSQMVITGKTYQFLASAAPVLIGQTKENESSQLFVDRDNCLLIPQADSKAIARSITWAATHPKKLHNIGQLGHKLYLRHFSNRVIGVELAGLMQELS